jgi:hypothetical protein
MAHSQDRHPGLDPSHFPPEDLLPLFRAGRRLYNLLPSLHPLAPTLQTLVCLEKALTNCALHPNLPGASAILGPDFEHKLEVLTQGVMVVHSTLCLPA